MFRKLLSHARQNAVAYLALFVALGGTGAYAANTINSTDIVDGQVKSVDIEDSVLGDPTKGIQTADLGQDSVNSVKIKDGAIKRQDLGPNNTDSSKVVDNSLTGADIDESTLGGVAGPNGTVITTTESTFTTCSGSLLLATIPVTLTKPSNILVSGSATPRRFDSTNYTSHRLEVHLVSAGNVVATQFGPLVWLNQGITIGDGTSVVGPMRSLGNQSVYVAAPGSYELRLNLTATSDSTCGYSIGAYSNNEFSFQALSRP